MRDAAGFDGFVAAQSRALVRFGWLLTGDPFAGEDLTQTALLRAWRKWDRVEAADDPLRYVRSIMVNTYLTSRRRKWHGEVPARELPEPSYDPQPAQDLRQELLLALGGLPPRQRTVLALRYYADCTEAETARLMKCSVGTVKSQSSKALATLRRFPRVVSLIEDEEVRR